MSQWKESQTKDGRTYYFNRETKQSSWQKPAELLTGGAPATGPAAGPVVGPAAAAASAAPRVVSADGPLMKCVLLGADLGVIEFTETVMVMVEHLPDGSGSGHLAQAVKFTNLSTGGHVLTAVREWLVESGRDGAATSHTPALFRGQMKLNPTSRLVSYGIANNDVLRYLATGVEVARAVGPAAPPPAVPAAAAVPGAPVPEHAELPYANVTRAEAEAQLAAQGVVGRFLLRPSSKAGALSLSFLSPEGAVGHLLLAQSADGWHKDGSAQRHETCLDLLASLPLPLILPTANVADATAPPLVVARPPSPAPPSGEVRSQRFVSGWLEKKNQNRFFVLDVEARLLFWFKDPPLPGTDLRTAPAQNHLDLTTDYVIHRGPATAADLAAGSGAKSLSFSLAPGGSSKGKRYDLLAGTAAEATLWTAAIGAALDGRRFERAGAVERPEDELPEVTFTLSPAPAAKATGASADFVLSGPTGFAKVGGAP